MQTIKTFILLLSIISLSSELDEQQIYKKYEKFIKKYNKTYSSIEEYINRYLIFRKNYLNLISNKKNTPKTWERGITKFSDLTKQEFRKQYLNLNPIIYDSLKEIDYEIPNKKNDEVPDEFNWLNEIPFDYVKNQKACGSCYAFSAIGNLESLYYLKTKKSILLSEQMIVDCDNVDAGCNGGLMDTVFNWIKDNGGIELAENYPYTGVEGTCYSDSSKYVSDLKITGFVKKRYINENDMKVMLYETGPLAIALNADLLMEYKSGIILSDVSECDPDVINHAVVLVGYGYNKEEDLDYWICKNSWDTDWGEGGYFRMQRGKGACGINDYVTTAVLE